MLDKPSINRLPGERLHLRHGPVSIVLKLWAAPEVMRQAHRLVMRHFPKIMPELEDEADELAKPLQKAAKFQSKIAQHMADAAAAFGSATVLAADALPGAVADEVLRIMAAAGPMDRAYVNNSGDIAFHLEPGQALKYGTDGDVSDAANAVIANTIVLTSAMGLGGIACTGSAVPGRSLSMGVAERVVVFAKTGAMAAAAATLVAHAVSIDSKAITRKPAAKVDAGSGLGDQLVVTKVGKLNSDEIDAALDAGAVVAHSLIAQGMIGGAVLALQDTVRTVGAMVQGIDKAVKRK